MDQSQQQQQQQQPHLSPLGLDMVQTVGQYPGVSTMPPLLQSDLDALVNGFFPWLPTPPPLPPTTPLPLSATNGDPCSFPMHPTYAFLASLPALPVVGDLNGNVPAAPSPPTAAGAVAGYDWPPHYLGTGGMPDLSFLNHLPPPSSVSSAAVYPSVFSMPPMPPSMHQQQQQYHLPLAMSAVPSMPDPLTSLPFLFGSHPSLAPPSGPVPHLFAPSSRSIVDASPARVAEHVSTSTAACPDSSHRQITRTTTTRTSAAGTTTMTTSTTTYTVCPSASATDHPSSAVVAAAAIQREEEPEHAAAQCLWFTCSATFEDAAELVPHLSTTHVPANHNRTNVCKWGGAMCAQAGAESFASADDLVHHLLEQHVRALFSDGGHRCDALSGPLSDGSAGTDRCMHNDSSSSSESNSRGSSPCAECPVATTNPTSDLETAGATNLRDLHVCLWTSCGSHYGSFSDLTEHVSAVHVGFSKPGYVCEWRECTRLGRPFPSRQKIMRHLQGHTGFKPYQCETCALRFSAPPALAQHLLTHSGAKPFACDACSKTFALLGSLNIHRRTHSGERPFACKTVGCEKRFGDSSNLTKHMRTHTKERPFRCPERACRKGFTRPDLARRHYQIVHRQPCVPETGFAIAAEVRPAEGEDENEDELFPIMQ
ncbi:hypothetical protein BC828DRAFT_307372 [Blastocladiella britannica]|nr:hypothetical protein BC828DRAFT_307372 [Blastocladiella britannica]